ncbi:MAG: cellulase family glycosylhydrolase [Actinomycetota bacterium]
MTYRRVGSMALLVCLLALWVAPVSAPATTTTLRVQKGKLLDAEDRDVILRGIAMINKASPYLPNFGAQDFALVRSWGMNSIRLGTSWRAIEPTKGEYDTGYLDRLAGFARAATDAGLYVIVDMHQDLWGGPWGNGAPDWATDETCPHVDSASYTGAWATNYLSPAVMCAFTNFWTSAELQDHYTKVWREVASRMADNPMVIGYDLMNEPYQGFIPPGVFETQFLYPSQSRWLKSARELDPKAIGFLEAPNYKNVHMPTVPAIDTPPNAVYAPHLYGFWDEIPGQGEQARGDLASANFRYSVVEAHVMGLPMWLGEFGIVHDAPGAAGFLRTVYDLADEAWAGTAYWEYSPGNSYSPIDRDRDPRATLIEIARPYPVAVPELTEFHFDAATAVFEATWTGSGDAVFAVPHMWYPDGPQVDIDGGSWAWNPTTAELTVTGGAGLTVKPA